MQAGLEATGPEGGSHGAPPRACVRKPGEMRRQCPPARRRCQVLLVRTRIGPLHASQAISETRGFSAPLHLLSIYRFFEPVLQRRASSAPTPVRLTLAAPDADPAFSISVSVILFCLPISLSPPPHLSVCFPLALSPPLSPMVGVMAPFPFLPRFAPPRCGGGASRGALETAASRSWTTRGCCTRSRSFHTC